MYMIQKTLEKTETIKNRESRDTRNSGYTIHRRQAKHKNTTQKTKTISNRDHKLWYANV